MKFPKAVLATVLLSACSLLHAQAPAGASGQCKDGTYSNAKSKSGACRGHQGIQTWYADSGTPNGSSALSAASTPAPAPSTAGNTSRPPAATPPAAPMAAPRPARAPSQPAAASQPAPGGGPGQVWVNSSTKVYHCSGDRYYGKTKNGSYMSESDAVAKGMRPDAGKPCSK